VVALVVIGFGVWLLLRRRSLSAGEIVLVAATSALLIAVAALGIQVASISTYLGYLRDQPLMPLTVAAVFALAAGMAATWLLVQVLRTSARAEVVS
jgi:hypothetical protein